MRGVCVCACLSLSLLIKAVIFFCSRVFCKGILCVVAYAVNVPVCVCVCVEVHVQRLVSLDTTTVQAIESNSWLNTAIR